MRTYELMVVLDPRMSEEEAATLTGDIQKLVESSGAEVIKMEVWGRRKLAYEIRKLNEGRYLLFYLGTENGSHSLNDVERRLQQNDQVLRFLTVRTDEELRRAGLPLPSADEVSVEAASVGAADAEPDFEADTDTEDSPDGEEE